MTRRTILSLLVILVVFGVASFSFWAVRVMAASQLPSRNTSQVLGVETEVATTPLPYPIIPKGTVKPLINARSYALYNVESGKIILQKNGEDAVPIASTTKLMTALLVAKYGKTTDVVTASDFAIETGGSIMGLHKNERMTVEDLLYGLMLVSGNDAAHTLAEYIGKILLNNPDATPEIATARFVQEMNAEAAHFHMDTTRYMDPAGLDDTGHSTAVDLAKVTSSLLQNELLQKIATTPEYTAYDVTGAISHNLKISNRLVGDYNYQGAGLGKTGFTPAAGHCLVATAHRENTTYVAVILSTYSTTADASALEARKLLDWGFSSVQYQ